MKKSFVYERIKINPELLNHKPPYKDIKLESFKKGFVNDTFSKGKCMGIYYNDFVNELDTWSAIDYQDPKPSEDAKSRDVSFICSHVNIEIKDVLGRMVTEPVDIKDYKKEHYTKGYKQLDLYIKHNEKITIEWDAMGDAFPPCGEFVFVIDTSCDCDDH